MAFLDDKPYPGKWQTDPKKDWHVEHKRVDALFAKLLKKQPKSTAKSLIGAVLSFPVADGRAHYVVTKQVPLTVQHVPIGDCWHIDRCHMNGIDEQEVRHQLEMHEFLSKAFGGKK